MFSFFPDKIPSHTTLTTPDITDPWPEELHGKFDLVHQRATLGSGMKGSPREAIRLLSKVVKPGGWIQLGEMDVFKPVRGGPATDDIWSVLAMFFNTVSRGNGNFANEMAERSCMLLARSPLTGVSIHLCFEKAGRCGNVDWLRGSEEQAGCLLGQYLQNVA
ncbi:hypothetical protein B0I35DRAFT_440796 [Stachybotrys elegans]|uniref:Uncharacterized protein n=1 Tax=Stachybotrys elegans TaxID=80388 RepID=A0A8K0WNX9_9HYPO|nr:hypothetical protein B0I35DRAFT_440796 [Stachybotrys elegans]